jgi:hypothetical protein
MDPVVQRELRAQAAKGLALENLLLSLFFELQRSGVLNIPAFGRVFDHTEDIITNLVMPFGGPKGAPEYCTEALTLVEELRVRFGLPKA